MTGHRRSRLAISRLAKWVFYATMPAVAAVALLVGFAYSTNPGVDRPLAAAVAVVAGLAWAANNPHRSPRPRSPVVAAVRSSQRQPTPVRVRSIRR